MKAIKMIIVLACETNRENEAILAFKQLASTDNSSGKTSTNYALTY